MKSFGWTDAEIRKQWKEHNRRELEDAANSVNLTLSVKESPWNREVSRNPEDVIAEMKPLDVLSLEISLGRTYGNNPIGLTINFGRFVGSAVKIVSINSEFVLIATDAL